MKKSNIILNIIVILSFLFSVSIVLPVKAECSADATVRVLPSFNLNIRSGVGKEFALLGTLNFDSGEQKSIELKNGYRRLEGQIDEKDRWIWDRYLTVVCNFPSPTVTATPTITSTPTVTPTTTATPTITKTIEPSPTRITPIPNTIFVWLNGEAFVCTNPCDLRISIK